MSIVVNTVENRTLLRTHRVGIGLLNAMYAESYYAELATRSERIHKLSTTATTVLSTAAAVTLLQSTAPLATPYVAVGAAVVSTVGTIFAWRNRTLAFAKASRKSADQVVEWTDLWETFLATNSYDQSRVGGLERQKNEVVEGIAPVPVRRRLGRKLQQRIRKQVGLPS